MGFSLKDSPAFEEWSTLTREQLHQSAMRAMYHLADCYEQQGKYAEALQHAWRQVELDPWQEAAHRQLMRLLALSGQRETALAQYEVCRQTLMSELGVEPEKETTQLYERIRTGALSKRKSVKTVSSSLYFSTARPTAPVPFVARDVELTRLDDFLEKALADQVQVAFITGGAGRGKTALIEEFGRRAQIAHPDLIVAGGAGTAYTGLGDPYLPFRQILGLLTSDIEAKCAAGTISQDHADRLRNLLPFSIQALVDVGPDLIDTFLVGEALIRRAIALGQWSEGIEWQSRFEKLVEHKATVPVSSAQQQNVLLEQYSRVLENLARHRPLLLILDDLQWADPGSLSLLFHLGRRLEASRILILGAYRPTDMEPGYLVTLGQIQDGPKLSHHLEVNGKREVQSEWAEQKIRHPLEKIINEFKRGLGDIEIDLGRTEDRQFVDDLLDTEPNQLGDSFRQTLFRQTKGHPLFTIELLRGMQERGDLVRDEMGRWVEGHSLDWQTLPVRVEAVIAERIARIPERDQQVLAVASVEGETFAAEVVARVRASDDREMVHLLGSKLDKVHRLLSIQGIQQIGKQRLSLYRFRHNLFQKYLYNNLDSAERAYLHEAVGTVLETFYGERAGEIAIQLVRHFQEAGVVPKAIDYLRQAGERAMRLCANEEAIAHISRALELLETLPDTPERNLQEVALRIALGHVLGIAKGYGLPEVARVYNRARELCQGLDESAQLFPVLFGLWGFHYTRAELPVACELGQQFLHLAQCQPDPALLVVGHSMVGSNLLSLGEIVSAREHLEQSLALYNRQQHRTVAFFYSHDPEMYSLAYLALCLWLLGYPDQALEKSRQALALDQEASHPVSLAFTLAFATILHHFRREATAVQEKAKALLSLSNRLGFATWAAAGTCSQDWALVEQGQWTEGIARMTKDLSALQATGSAVFQSNHFAQLAEVFGKVGEANKGLAFLDKALGIANQTGERYYEAEIYRLKGELLMKVETEGMPNKTSSEDYFLDAESCFQRAIEVARAQQAKSLELRTTMSLARLWQKLGKVDEAQEMLAKIYGWFTEGFDTADLQEANMLLEELSAKPA